MISLLIWIVLGFLAGFIAKAIMPGPDGGGFILTTILGIVGAVIGGFIGNALFGGHLANDSSNLGNSLYSFVFSVIGAIIVLAIWKAITGRKA